MAKKKAKLDSAPKADALGKPTEHSEHVSHSIDVDAKGRKHHRIHHHTSTTYEMHDSVGAPKAPPTLMNQLLAKRGK